MSLSYYITPQEYEIAKQNGISRATLEYRIRDLAWDMSKAINTPPRKKKSLKEWRTIADQNGIPYPAFQKRMHVYNWDPERAATEPLQDRRELAKMGREACMRKLANCL